MKQTQNDLIRLLLCLDHNLKIQAHLLVIDFPVYSLAYYPGAGVTEVPVDVTEQLRYAHSNAMGQAGVQIPFHSVPVSDFPFLFETRLSPLPVTGLQRLKVDVLDRHDAVVACLIHGDRRQLSTIQSMGRQAGLSYESLVDSFCAIDPSNGNMGRMKQELLNLIEVVFGETSMMQAEAIIAERMS